MCVARRGRPRRGAIVVPPPAGLDAPVVGLSEADALHTPASRDRSIDSPESGRAAGFRSGPEHATGCGSNPGPRAGLPRASPCGTSTR